MRRYVEEVRWEELPGDMTGRLRHFHLLMGTGKATISLEFRQSLIEQKYALFHEVAHLFFDYSAVVYQPRLSRSMKRILKNSRWSNEEKLVEQEARIFCSTYPEYAEKLFRRLIPTRGG
ncbi:MAG: hypothetical protein AAB903_03200 [Patescibacteria group bacterium]